MITSTHNERVKYVRSLVRRRAREREDRFVVEGTRLVDEMVRAGVRPALVLYTTAWAADPDGQRLLPSLARAAEGAWEVSGHVLAACADTVTPQGVLAVVPSVRLASRPGLILILDRLADPGNLGTILRSAEATEVGQVILPPGTVDLFSPKTVRAAMGAHFYLPVAQMEWGEIAARVSGRAVWLADARGETVYDEIDWRAPAALIIGGEAAGSGEEANGLATGRISIPMSADTESLNAAMAATVILFEAARQNRTARLRASS